MRTVAIAGGLGQLGRCLVDGLAEFGSDRIYVLSRSSPPATTLPPGVTVLQVDYNNVASMSQVLEAHSIDTVICALGVLFASASQAQLNLIQAAEASSTTERFILSSFESMHTKEQVATNPLAAHVFDAIAAVEKTKLEYTRIVNGWFLDYYGMPHWPTHLHPWNSIVNVAEKWAVIPSDGSGEATFITTRDLAKFISGLLHLSDWDDVTCIAGDTISFNALLELAQEVRGCKFEVAHDSLESLKSGKISFSDRFPPTGISDPVEHERFLATLHYEAGTGKFKVPSMQRLNERLPEINITTVRQLLESSWKQS
jgi:nucleoside-diphosphate-sugar epimerase